MAKKSGYAIVTGSARGIGKHCAIQCAKEGYDVVLNYTSERGAKYIEETLSEVKACGVNAIVVCADLSKFEECQKFFDESVKAFGEDIEVLINNAGISVGSPFVEVEAEQMLRTINVNLMSQLYCTKLALPYMIKQRKGWIINMSSNSGIMGVEGYADYSASKGGSIAFTKAIAKEVAQYDIKVNAIAPGCFLTHMVTDSGEENMERLRQLTPLRKLGELSDMELLVHYLVNTEFLTGQVISPNGGWTI
jgi:3-oxoacyl-[acyl-carrier protein] reductase